MAVERTELSSGWRVRRGDSNASDEEAWIPVHSVPTVVHLDLLRAGDSKYSIPDPFQDLNELDVRWVGEKSWIYSTTFIVPEDALEPRQGSPSSRKRLPERVQLVFRGLDTFATVFLNSALIMESDNMFTEWHVEVGNLVYRGPGRRNKLEIFFAPAGAHGLELIKAHPEHRFIVHQTEISRAPVRKAQYHWGWDWGPILLTCGPWKPIVLERYVARIADAQITYAFSPGLSKASVKVNVWIEGTCGPGTRLLFEVRKGAWRISRVEPGPGLGHGPVSIEAPARSYTAEFEIENVELWWPRGYGKQELYEVKAQLFLPAQDGGGAGVTVLDQASRKIGFRCAELVQEKDEFGQSFYFRINNVDVFAGGSCWVPADSFLPAIDAARYRAWVELLAEGNQVMVRVWGGGIYEADAFYDACDELGVLVWQDFAFACANYPAAIPKFRESVEREARQNVRRLRHHPCLVVWAGNNEDYQIVERYGLEYRFDEDKDPNSWLRTDFPARYFYEHLLPEIICGEYEPGGGGSNMGKAAYHPSSPWGNGKSTTLKVDPTVGDVHQWDVWHGAMRPYQELPLMGGRFVSEFGMEAHPHMSTLARSVTDPVQLHPASAVMDFRNKAVGHEQRLLKYVGENFRIKYDMPSFVHLTQVMQADAVTWAYRGWRRQWGAGADGSSRKCGGVLVWQLNDCWPTTSWAVVDYYMVKKPAFYAIKRALAPLAVAVERRFSSWTMRPADGKLWQRDTGHFTDPREAARRIVFDVWVASSRLVPVRGKVILRYIYVDSGREALPAEHIDVEIRPNGTTEVLAQREITLKAPDDKPLVVEAALWVDGVKVSSDVSWPEPIKYLDLGGDRGVTVRQEVLADRKILTISASKPVKGFVFEEFIGISLSDNGFDLVPGSEKIVEATGVPLLSNASIPWRYVGQE